MKSLRFMVAADIHADTTDRKTTHVIAEPPSARPGQQPLADLASFIETEQLKADYFFAAGDLANRANAAGLAYGWRKANVLAQKLGAKLIGVPGNHDVVTHSSVADPRQPLKALLPTFPSSDPSLDTFFWEHGWALKEGQDHRILLIDSTRDFPPHPGVVNKRSKAWKNYVSAIDRGSFPSSMQDEIAAALAGLEEKLNVAVVHHHPFEHQNHVWLQDEYGPMHRGSELIELLSNSANTGRWFIVHGHKHVPQLVSATSLTTNGPIVLCGGSVGATMWHPVSTVARNQFHIVNLALDGPMPGLSGTIESFTWGFGNGWRFSERQGSGLPTSAGFGSTDHFRALGVKADDALRDSGEEFMTFESLVARVPALPYILPADWDLLENELDNRGIIFTRDRQHKVVQISRVGVS